MSLRAKLYLLVLPPVIATVILISVVSSFEIRAALTRVADRHMAFKAEQIRDYFQSEWDVLSRLGLQEKPEYRPAIEDSFRTYAFSLLRGESEQIFVFDGEGRALMRLGLRDPALDQDRGKAEAPVRALPTGWFSRLLFGEERVGVSFGLPSVGWTVAVTDLRSSFFQDANRLQIALFLILGAALAALVALLAVFVRHITGPLERLTATVADISSTADLTRRADVEYPDEIGTLAFEFNGMVASLQANYRRMEKATHAAIEARRVAVARTEETLFLLGRVSDFRDEETGKHLKRIGSLAERFAFFLGLDEEGRKLLLHAAPLHDIGKIGIPDAILLKPGRLTGEEFEIIKKHAAIGYELLKDAEGAYLVEGARIALTHHEKWDGSGYPRGLAGEDIPLSGRIVGLADVFDALITRRSYKEAWEPERALAYVEEQSGKHFDPALVSLFREHFAELMALTEKLRD